MTICEAATQLGRDAVLNDPTDDEIILAAVELAKGNWPQGFSVDRYFAREIVAAYEKGVAENGA
jgi:hypothetical protein